MKRMYILLVVLLSLGSGILAQSRFAVGFEAGYKDGWCYDRGVGCLPPLPPIAPIPKIGEDMNSYQDGYKRGFMIGQQDSAAKKGNTTNTVTRQRYQTDKPVFEDSKDLVYNPDYKAAAIIQQQALRYNQYHEEKERQIVAQIRSFVHIKKYDEAIDLAERIERPLTKYSVKAIVYQEKGDIISAYNNYYECLSYDENNKEIKEELNILSEVINIKFNEAIQKREFNKALWIGRTIQNTIFSYSLQGYVYYVMRDFYEAKKFFKKIKSQSKYAKEMLKTIKKEEKEEN
ncbi:hypothetical protein [Capnocytophaga cynodegmi]|uniref:hypothetical protein n=1 Tax=Capnocytophaga cynodegmi TaxID=28189 RepID=UPI00385B70F9